MKLVRKASNDFLYFLFLIDRSFQVVGEIYNAKNPCLKLIKGFVFPHNAQFKVFVYFQNFRSFDSRYFFMGCLQNVHACFEVVHVCILLYSSWDTSLIIAHKPLLFHCHSLFFFLCLFNN